MYYVPLISEWEVLDIGEQKEYPDSRNEPIFFQDKSQLFILSGLGSKTNDYNPSPGKIFTDSWSFSFKSNRWKFLGTSNIDYRLISYVAFSDDKFIYCILPEKLIAKVDIKNNNFSLHKGTELAIKSIAKGVRSKSITKAINGYIPILKIDPHKNYILKLSKVNDLFNEFVIHEGRVYDNSFQKLKQYSFWITVFVLALILITILKKRIHFSNQPLISISNNKLLYRGSHVFLNDSKEFEIISALAQKNELSNSEIIDIIDDDNGSFESLKKRKLELIKGINSRVRFLTRSNQDLIKERQSELDKRMKVYVLNTDMIRIIDAITK